MNSKKVKANPEPDPAAQSSISSGSILGLSRSMRTGTELRASIKSSCYIYLSLQIST